MTAPTGGSGDATWMTTAMLKAFTHPLRRRIMRLLSQRDSLRAADVAAELGVPANTASFHLRALGDAGLIAEDPAKARDRRDRVWVAVKGSYNLGDAEHPVPDEALGVAALGVVAEEHAALVGRVVTWSREYVTGRAPEMHGSLQQRHLRLTPAEFERLLEGIDRLASELAESHDDTDPESRRWQMDIIAADETI